MRLFGAIRRTLVNGTERSRTPSSQWVAREHARLLNITCHFFSLVCMRINCMYMLLAWVRNGESDGIMLPWSERRANNETTQDWWKYNYHTSGGWQMVVILEMVYELRLWCKYRIVYGMPHATRWWVAGELTGGILSNTIFFFFLFPLWNNFKVRMIICLEFSLLR